MRAAQTASPDTVTAMFEDIEQQGDTYAEALYSLAETHSGYLTAREAAAAGISRGTISHHARPGGRLLRASRGVYRLRDFPSSPHEHIVAAWLSTPPSADAVISHESALELDDLADVIADAVHVTVPRTHRRKAINGVVVHATTFPVTSAQRRLVLGVPVTTVERTVIDMLRAGGLTEQVEAAADQALRRGLTTKRRLAASAADFPATVQRQIARLVR